MDIIYNRQQELFHVKHVQQVRLQVVLMNVFLLVIGVMLHLVLYVQHHHQLLAIQDVFLKDGTQHK